MTPYPASGFPLISSGSLLVNEATQQMELGSLRMDEFGNLYRYIKANEALAIGQIVTSVPFAAWDTTIVIDGAVASGDTTIHVDTNTSVITVNQFAGYYIKQATAASKGMALRIKSHPAIGASSEMDVVVEKASAEVISDGVALNIFNPYLMELVDADTEQILGVALGTITSAYYGWVQVAGFVEVVEVGHSTSAAIVLDEPLVPVAANPGAVQGMAGNAEADIMEAACSPLIALEAVAANTTGYTCAYMKRFV